MSAIYSGTVRHRRTRELEHAFSYPVDLMLIDLDELPRIADGRLLRPWPGAWRFRRRDFHGDPARPLADAVRDTVAARLGDRPRGPVRVLTQLRCFGMAFNPVSFYYCYDPAGERVDAVLAEVTNTPWRERHAYVLGPFGTGSRVLRSTLEKVHHVSPFMPMDQTYTISLTEPGPTLSVHIAADGAAGRGREFDATLALRRRELTSATLNGLIRRDPTAPLRTLRRIYAEGIGLKVRGITTHPHPPLPSAPGRATR